MCQVIIRVVIRAPRQCVIPTESSQGGGSFVGEMGKLLPLHQEGVLLLPAVHIWIVQHQIRQTKVHVFVLCLIRPVWSIDMVARGDCVGAFVVGVSFLSKEGESTDAARPTATAIATITTTVTEGVDRE